MLCCQSGLPVISELFIGRNPSVFVVNVQCFYMVWSWRILHGSALIPLGANLII